MKTEFYFVKLPVSVKENTYKTKSEIKTINKKEEIGLNKNIELFVWFKKKRRDLYEQLVVFFE